MDAGGPPVKRCSECKHWDRHGNPISFDYKSCKAPEGSDPGFVIDGGDGNDGLYTSPNFFCKLFEPIV
jgi:hypothetical protein